MSVRIILVDDYDAIRQAQRRILETESDFEIVGEACNGRKAIELVEQLRPDVVIIDINMPEINGIEATRIIHQSHPEVKVISYSSHSEKAYVLDMMRAGASGYVLKQSHVSEIS
jgi:DNA-binding NarL/FixJ family response regulator